MGETQFVYSLLAAVVVTFLITVRIFRWRQRRRDLARIHAMLFIIEFEKQKARKNEA